MSDDLPATPPLYPAKHSHAEGLDAMYHRQEPLSLYDLPPRDDPTGLTAAEAMALAANDGLRFILARARRAGRPVTCDEDGGIHIGPVP